MNEQISSAKEKMEKCIKNLENEFASIRAGRANPSVLDKVVVDYYGAPTPLNQMAAISVSEARILVIQPWDMSSMKAIEKAIINSDVGITPTNDGKAIRLVFPQLTEERRKELCKSIKKYGEECKVSIRSIRRDCIEKFKSMKKNSEITEDDMKEYEKEVQDITDKFCVDADKSVTEKEKEIMSI
ncbi:MAG: ribosome recycling factor [Ruminococcus sp.]|jgi:ribosome recycling factor|nr:ribosome recycling factor [Ruminococcus sp.]